MVTRWMRARLSTSSLIALALGVAIAGCSARTPVSAPDIRVSPLPPVEPEPYRLQVGDLLSVQFWGSPELDQEVRILPDGSISLPFVDQVQAQDRTLMELDDELTRRYSKELTRAEITVMVREIGSYKVYVGGEVAGQGVVPLIGRMSVFQAITEAGGFLTTARRRQVLLIRTERSGERHARSLDLRQVQSGANPAADIVLQPSDIVFVPRTKITNVNLFVSQYIDQLLPIRPVATIELFGDDGLFESGSSTTPPPPPPPPPGSGGGGRQ